LRWKMRIWLVDMASVFSAGQPRSRTHFRLAGMADNGVHIGRIAFLVYAGFLLIEADQEIEGLKYTRARLEEAIAEFQRSNR